MELLTQSQTVHGTYIQSSTHVGRGCLPGSTCGGIVLPRQYPSSTHQHIGLSSLKQTPMIPGKNGGSCVPGVAENQVNAYLEVGTTQVSGDLQLASSWQEQRPRPHGGIESSSESVSAARRPSIKGNRSPSQQYIVESQTSDLNSIGCICTWVSVAPHSLPKSPAFDPNNHHD